MSEKVDELKKLLQETIEKARASHISEEKKELVIKALEIVGDAVNPDGRLDMLKVNEGTLPIVRRLEELGADVTNITEILFRLTMREASRLMAKASA